MLRLKKKLSVTKRIFFFFDMRESRCLNASTKELEKNDILSGTVVVPSVT